MNKWARINIIEHQHLKQDEEQESEKSYEPVNDRHSALRFAVNQFQPASDHLPHTHI